MIRTFASATAVLVLLVRGASAACPVPALPDSFTLGEKLFTVGTVLKVQSKDPKGEAYDHGKIRQKIWNWTTTMEYVDEKGAKVARAKSKFFSLVDTVVVTDCEGKKIGTLKERFWKSLLKVTTQYSILDANDAVIATSDKFDLFVTDFELKDKSGRALAKVHRPLSLLRDKWKVTLANRDVVDPRLIVMIGALKTASDRQKQVSSALEALAQE